MQIDDNVPVPKTTYRAKWPFAELLPWQSIFFSPMLPKSSDNYLENLSLAQKQAHVTGKRKKMKFKTSLVIETHNGCEIEGLRIWRES